MLPFPSTVLHTGIFCLSVCVSVGVCVILSVGVGLSRCELKSCCAHYCTTTITKTAAVVELLSPSQRHSWAVWSIRLLNSGKKKQWRTNSRAAEVPFSLPAHSTSGGNLRLWALLFHPYSYSHPHPGARSLARSLCGTGSRSASLGWLPHRAKSDQITIIASLREDRREEKFRVKLGRTWVGLRKRVTTRSTVRSIVLSEKKVAVKCITVLI